MNLQTTVDRLAGLARLRLVSLLRLSTARHIYDPTPGALNSKFVDGSSVCILDQWKNSQQPYKDLERFIAEERVMQSVIDPGLLPVAKAIARDVLGKKMLVTRRIAPRRSDKGVVAHVAGYGVRVLIYTDDATTDTIVAWECLYGVV